MARSAEQDRVQALQHALYRAAKADPGRRFHALFDKVSRRDVVQRAWERVRRNRGAAGVDEVTIAAVEEFGVGRLAKEFPPKQDELLKGPGLSRHDYESGWHASRR